MPKNHACFSCAGVKAGQGPQGERFEVGLGDRQGWGKRHCLPELLGKVRPPVSAHEPLNGERWGTQAWANPHGQLCPADGIAGITKGKD